MFCTKCGKELADGAKFCQFCGNPVPVLSIEEPKPAEEPKPVEEPKPAEEPKPVEAPKAAEVQPTTDASKLEKKNNVTVYILLGLIIAVIIFIAGLVKSLFSSNSQDPSVFFISNSKVKAVLDVKAREPVEVQLQKIKNYDVNDYNHYGQISPDNKYIYFVSDVDSYDEATLCRFPVDKLSKNEGKMEKYIVEIDDKVSKWGILKNGDVYYLKANGDLMLYNGKESYELASHVDNYLLSKDKDCFYITSEKNDEYELSAVLPKAGASVEKIDNNIDKYNIPSLATKDCIFYMKRNEDNKYDLFKAGFAKEPELIAEKIRALISSDVEAGTAYYTADDAASVTLYSYVNDDCATSDQKYLEKGVDARDYMVQVKLSELIGESAIRELGGETYIINDFKNEGYYSEEYDLYYAYADYVYIFFDDKTKTWYTDFDEDAYEEACDELELVKDREAIREELKSQDMEESYQNLYYYSRGNSSLICDSVKYVVANDGVAIFIYRERNAVEPVCLMSEVDYAYLVREKVYDIQYQDNEHSDSLYYSINGSQMKEYNELDNVDGIYITDKSHDIYVCGGDDRDGYTLLAYNNADTELKNGEEISDECYVMFSGDDYLIYIEDKDETSANYFRLEKNKSTLLAQNSHGILIYDDGTIVGRKGYDYGEFDLTLFDKNGKGERLVKGVDGFSYLGNGCYLYTKDDSLYFIDKKKEEKRIAKNVDMYWSPMTVKGTSIGY